MMRSAEFYADMHAPSREDRLARIDALTQRLNAACIILDKNIRFGLDALIGLLTEGRKRCAG
jgi:hypothetical protein